MHVESESMDVKRGQHGTASNRTIAVLKGTGITRLGAFHRDRLNELGTTDFMIKIRFSE